MGNVWRVKLGAVTAPMKIEEIEPNEMWTHTLTRASFWGHRTCLQPL